jgi:hypothetical protein
MTTTRSAAQWHYTQTSRDRLTRHCFQTYGGSLPSFEPPQGDLVMPDFEERAWTGGYIFENEWQSFCTRQSRDLELTTAVRTYDRPSRYTMAVKVIDIFSNDTMTLVPVNVGSRRTRLQWRYKCG